MKYEAEAQIQDLPARPSVEFTLARSARERGSMEDIHLKMPLFLFLMES
jgi:hypothetical protein